METLFRQIDGYCERTDASYWAEPINAVTNLGFVVVAVLMFSRVTDPIGRALCVILGCIGVGSYLFHTHATVWAVILDVVPIMLFSLLYIFASNLRFWNMPIWAAVLGTVLYFPYSAGVSWAAAQFPFLEISASYWPLPVLIAGYGLALLRRHPGTGRGLLIGAALLCASLVARSVDESVCVSLPIGTHFVWHVLNAALLGWMIEVYRRHMLAVPASQG